MSDDKPHRRFEVEIKLSGDSEEEIQHGLDQLSRDWAEGGLRLTSTSGGWGYGWIVTTTERPEQTHDGYFEDVRRWQASHPRDA